MLISDLKEILNEYKDTDKVEFHISVKEYDEAYWHSADEVDFDHENKTVNVWVYTNDLLSLIPRDMR